MAGRPQGGAAPQQNMGQMGNQMQGMRQGMAGMPSQYPGANLAAPGGGMAAPAVMPQGSTGGQTMPAPAPQSTTIPMYDNRVNAPAPAPQLPPQYSGSTNPTQLDPSMMAAIYQQAMAQQGQGQGMARPAVMPQGPTSVGAYSPQAPQVSRPMPMMNDARFQQNPGMTPRMMGANPPIGRPQVQGNPNAMPVQRSPRRSMMG